MQRGTCDRFSLRKEKPKVFASWPFTCKPNEYDPARDDGNSEHHPVLDLDAEDRKSLDKPFAHLGMLDAGTDTSLTNPETANHKTGRQQEDASGRVLGRKLRVKCKSICENSHVPHQPSSVDRGFHSRNVLEHSSCRLISDQASLPECSDCGCVGADADDFSPQHICTRSRWWLRTRSSPRSANPFVSRSG